MADSILPQAEAAIREALPDPAAGALTVRYGDLPAASLYSAGEAASIPFADIERDYDIETMLALAYSVGRDGSIVDELRTLNHSSNVEPQITWDSAALMRAIESVAGEAESVPVDATIARDGVGLRRRASR